MLPALFRAPAASASALLAGRFWARSVPLGALLVAALTACWLLYVRRQLYPAWEPTGHDWDQWYATALSTRTNLRYPNNRWPLSGWVMLAAQATLPLPAHVAAAMASVAAMSAAVAAIWWTGVRLVGWPAACAAAVLAVGHPEVTASGGNIGPYALWVCAAALAVLALTEAVRTEHLGWWAFLGLAWGAGMAVLEKGLGIGLTLGALVSAVHAFRLWKRRAEGPARWQAPAATLAGFSVLAVAYAFFPQRLWSLDEMMALAATGNVGANGYHAGLYGWVFGQRMDPLTIWNTLQAGARLGTSADSQAVLDRIVVPDSYLIAAMGIGACSALVAALRSVGSEPHRTAGWLAVAAVLAGTAPALTAAVPQARFLLPGLALLPLVLVAPFAHLRARWGAAALLLLPLCLWEGSPWEGRFWRAFPIAHDAEWQRRRLLAQVYNDTRSLLPDVPVDVVSPLAGGYLLVDGRGGSVIETPDLRGVTPVPEHGLVFPLDRPAQGLTGLAAASLDLPAGAPDLAGRTVLAAWPTLQPGRTLLLVGPVTR